MARLNVFLRDDLLKALDAEAEQAGTSRSSLLERALLKYFESRRRPYEEAEAQSGMDEACRRMDALAEKLGDWDPVKIIKQFRDPRCGSARDQNRDYGPKKRS